MLALGDGGRSISVGWGLRMSKGVFRRVAAYSSELTGMPVATMDGVEVGRAVSVAYPIPVIDAIHALVRGKCCRNCCRAAGVVKMMVGRSCMRARRSSIFFWPTKVRVC